MKSTLICPSSPAPAPATWFDLVVRAVDADDRQQLTDLLSGADSKRRLVSGFTLGEQGTVRTFAQVCLDRGRFGSLRAAIEASPSSISLHDCSGYRRVDGRSGLLVSEHSSFHEEAVIHANPAALALALEFQPNYRIVELKRFDGRSLHYDALYRATMSKTIERCQGLAHCCRLLIAAGAPIRSANLGVSSPVDMLFLYRWQMDGIESVVVQLIGDYVRAGLVDLDDAVPSDQYPAGIASLSGNGHAAAAAIDPRCRLDLAASGTGHANIITAAQACLVSHCQTETVSLVTAAVMRRQIKSALPAEASTSQIGRGARRPSV